RRNADFHASLPLELELEPVVGAFDSLRKRQLVGTVDDDEACGAAGGGGFDRLLCGEVPALARLRQLEGRFAEKHVGAARELDEVRARRGVGAVGERPAPARDAKAVRLDLVMTEAVGDDFE